MRIGHVEGVNAALSIHLPGNSDDYGDWQNIPYQLRIRADAKQLTCGGCLEDDRGHRELHVMDVVTVR